MSEAIKLPVVENMSNRLPTFSALDRAKACPGSCALPQVKHRSSAAERGTIIHDFVLSQKRGDDKLPEVPEQYRTFCEGIDIDAIPVGTYEVAFGIDADTGLARKLGEGLNRNYPGDLRVGELVGTVDIYNEITIGEEKAVYVGDVKTGLANHVPPVRDNLQVGVGALAAARIAGVSAAITEIVRIKDNGSVVRETAILDGWALDALELEVREVVRQIRKELAVADAGGIVTVTSGPHCAFCPAFAHCPAQTNLALALADPKGLEKEIMGALTPESAPVIYRKYKAAQEVLNKIRNAIYGYAEQQEFDVGNGFVLGPVRVVKPKLDAAMAHRILARDFGAEAAAEAVDWKTSKKAIRAVLRRNSKYGNLGKAEARFLAELQTDGGLKLTEHIEIRPHRAGVDAQEGDDE